MERARGELDPSELRRQCAGVFAVILGVMVVLGFFIQGQKVDAEHRRAVMAANDTGTKKIVEHESFLDAMLSLKGLD